MSGNFFAVNMDVLSMILFHFRQYQWIDPILAYLVLCKHQQRGEPYTTAGALAINKTLGLTRYRAEQVIRELEEVDWGRAPDERAVVNHHVLKRHPELGYPHTKGMFPLKLLPRLSTDCIWFPNRILKEKEGKPFPLARLNNIESSLVRYDALSILLHCYAFHDIQGSGGLDPRRTFCSPWCYEGTCMIDQVKLGYQGEKKDKKSKWHFWLVAASDEVEVQPSFIDTTTDGDSNRFFEAFACLVERRFFVKVAMVFAGDPFVDPTAEPLYPLRVFDELYRQNAKALKNGQGGLYGETFNCLDRSLVMENSVCDFRQEVFWEYAKTGESSGCYAVAARVKTAMVVNVFRLRFCPHDHDTGIGFQEEANRSEHWKEALSQAFREI